MDSLRALPSSRLAGILLRALCVGVFSFFSFSPGFADSSTAFHRRLLVQVCGFLVWDLVGQLDAQVRCLLAQQASSVKQLDAALLEYGVSKKEAARLLKKDKLDLLRVAGFFDSADDVGV